MENEEILVEFALILPCKMHTKKLYIVEKKGWPFHSTLVEFPVIMQTGMRMGYGHSQSLGVPDFSYLSGPYLSPIES